MRTILRTLFSTACLGAAPAWPAAADASADTSWLLLGGLAIVLVIAVRRCQWASLRGGTAVAPHERPRRHLRVVRSD